MKFYSPNNEALAADRSKDAREVANQAGVAQFFLKPGITHVRVLPPFNERGVWYREIWEYNVVIDGQRRVFTAPSQTGQPDPFEEKKNQLIQAGGDLNIKLAEGLKVSRRFLFNALVWVTPPGVEFKHGEVVVLKAPVTVKRALLEMDQDVQGGWADITNPSSGVNVKISRTGKGLNTTYQVSPMPQRTSLAQDLMQVQVDVNGLNLYNLDELYLPLPYEELKVAANKITASIPTLVQAVVPAGYVQVTPQPVTVQPVTVQPVALPPPPVVVPGVVVSSTTIPMTPVVEQFVPGMQIPPPPPPIK